MKEKIFWGALAITAGIIGGAVAACLLSPRSKTVECNDGRSEQVEDGVRYKTYIPALDECK